MTIAVGFACDEGIILATDSQETLSDLAKEHREKIVTTFTKDYIVAFAGAGDSDYIETAIEEAEDYLRGCKTIKDIKDIREKLKEGLLAFFVKHLLIWPQRERPGVALLIGVVTKGGHDLLYYQGTSFYRVRQRAIGTGEILAKHLIFNYCTGAESIDEFASIAAYIISTAKTRVDGCGGFTNLIALKRGMNFGLTEPKEIDKIEAQLENKAEESNRKSRSVVVSHKVSISWLSRYECKKIAEENTLPFFT